MIVDCHIYAATLVAMKLSLITKILTPAHIVLKPFSASEAPYAMAESTKLNVFFEINKINK